MLNFSKAPWLSGGFLFNPVALHSKSDGSIGSQLEMDSTHDRS